MATYFGEITALSSRAADDDDGEEEPTYNFQVEIHSENLPLSFKLIVFSVGKLATSFAHSHIIPENSRLLFDIRISLDKDYEDIMMYSGGLHTRKSKSVVVASVYSVNNEVVVCDISEKVPEDYISELCSILLEKIQVAQALVLTARHMSTYKNTTIENEASFLRCLSTSTFSAVNTPAISRLQSPNYISGFAAAVLTHFEVQKKDAMCVINYVDSSELDSFNVLGFESILRERFSITLPVNSDATTKLANYIRTHSNQSNLYT